MPEFLRGPELTALKCELPSAHLAPVHAVLKVLSAPADHPALGHVLRAAASCCHEAVRHMSVIAPEIVEVDEALRAAAAVVADMPAVEGAALMRGQITVFPAWNLFAGMVLTSSPEARCLAGAEVLTALILGGETKFRPGIAVQITNALRNDPERDTQKALGSMRVFALKLLADIAAWTATKPSSKSLRLTARVKASIAQQMDPQNLDDRRSCRSARELSVGETIEAAAILKRKVLEGDGLSLSIVIAHCCGPTWDTVVEFPFSEHAGSDWIAQIDVVAEVVKIDLTSLLELPPGKEGHQPASPVLVIPMPKYAADKLRNDVASTPAATCLTELYGLEEVTSRTVLPGMPHDAPIPATIARFIRTRATVAIEAGVDRGAAAYGCGDLSKVGKSSHSYLTVSLDEIWECNARRYSALEWGAPAPRGGVVGVAVGSMVTPTRETVRRIDQLLVAAADGARAGRKYTSSSVVRHHNAFARLCAHRTSFFTLARAASNFEFYADMLDESCAIGGLIDKRVGPFEGGTPLPMPVRLATQLRLWMAHLRALRARILKLKPQGWQRIVRRIDAVLDDEHVRLFFLLEADGSIREFGSDDLLAQHPEIRVKGDYLRHFVFNELRRAGVPFSMASMQLRHHIDALSLADLCSGVPMLLALQKLAHALDLIALEMGIHPVSGLSRGKEARCGVPG